MGLIESPTSFPPPPEDRYRALLPQLPGSQKPTHPLTRCPRCRYPPFCRVEQRLFCINAAKTLDPWPPKVQHPLSLATLVLDFPQMPNAHPDQFVCSLFSTKNPSPFETRTGLCAPPPCLALFHDAVLGGVPYPVLATLALPIFGWRAVNCSNVMGGRRMVLS